MPPNSTQNLNAKLSLSQSGRSRRGGSAPVFSRPPIQSSGSSTKIFGGPSPYRGGYHLSV
jgi:hypothetical protein